MMEIVVLAGIPILLLLMLSLLGATWDVEEDTGLDAQDGWRHRYPGEMETGACVRRIFSQEDREFVDRQDSERLRRIYRAERTKIALFWVWNNSRAMQQVMREHRLAARESKNLQAGRELVLLFHYMEFRLLCASLVCLIRVFGPHALINLATYAMEVSQSIDRVVEELTSGTRVASAGQMGGA